MCACISLKPILKSRSFKGQGHRYRISRSNERKSIFVCCKCFCDLCVMRMVHLRLKGILVYILLYIYTFSCHGEDTPKSMVNAQVCGEVNAEQETDDFTHTTHSS